MVICVGAGRACSGHNSLRRTERDTGIYPGNQRPRSVIGNPCRSHGGANRNCSAIVDNGTIPHTSPVINP
jgi:hypothetical protein